MALFSGASVFLAEGSVAETFGVFGVYTARALPRVSVLIRLYLKSVCLFRHGKRLCCHGGRSTSVHCPGLREGRCRFLRCFIRPVLEVSVSRLVTPDTRSSTFFVFCAMDYLMFWDYGFSSAQELFGVSRLFAVLPSYSFAFCTLPTAVMLLLSSLSSVSSYLGCKGNQFKNKRVLMEAIHKKKGETARIKALKEQVGTNHEACVDRHPVIYTLFFSVFSSVPCRWCFCLCWCAFRDLSLLRGVQVHLERFTGSHELPCSGVGIATKLSISDGASSSVSLRRA